MALTEKTIYDKVEVVGDEGWTIQWRRNTQILKDGNVVANNYHRGLVEPVNSSYDLENKKWVFTEHDMSKEPFTDTKVKSIATAMWTDNNKTEFKKWVEDNRTPK
tara:strand:+ start:486 stop:800 length:315 start_codon:yes stop_codon:yes gene_type:complete